VRFLHRNPPGSSGLSGKSCFSANPYSLRRWQHVVATKSANEMNLYIDGKLVATQVDRTDLPDNLHLLIGQAGAVGRILPFVGQLDELAIYGHALTKKEVEEHYQSLSWKQVNPPATGKDSI
jgi:hypothetical protein